MPPRTSPEPAPPSSHARPTVGHLLELVAQAFGLNKATVINEIARNAAAPKGDSDPSRETILSYIKEPRSAVVQGKRISRRNKQTPIHHKFAHLVLNYLDGQRPDKGYLEASHTGLKSSSWQEARAICARILREERERRFKHPLGSDPGSQSILERIAGVYAVCRQETHDRNYDQELLILRNAGTPSAPRCYCTYVSDQVVTRGEWMLIGSVVHCSMSGLRQDNSHEIGGLYLAHIADYDILTGFLAGAGTDVKIPVAMPLVAIRVTNSHPTIY